MAELLPHAEMLPARIPQDESIEATVPAAPGVSESTGDAEITVAEDDVPTQPVAEAPRDELPAAADAASTVPADTTAAVPADEAPVVPVPAEVELELEKVAKADAAPPTAPEPVIAERIFQPVAAIHARSINASSQVATAEKLEPVRVPAELLFPMAERRYPLRFVWQIDSDGRFTVGSEEFVALAGPTTAALLGRPWRDIANALGSDPEHRVARVLATRDTWSGVTVAWPVDGSPDRLTIELSGLPAFDRDRQFRGYRGFGVCRDINRLNALARMRAAVPAPSAPTSVTSPAENVLSGPANEAASKDAESADTEPPTLSHVEHHAFYELSRRLTHRLNHDDDAFEFAVEQSESLLSPADDMRQLFDRLPVGVLIYRLEHLIYANRAFLQATGHDSLDDLVEAGGLDSLLLAPDRSPIETAPGKPFSLAIAKRGDEEHVQAELIPVLWESEAAHALLMIAHAVPLEGTAEITGAQRPPSQDELAAAQAAVAEAKDAVAQAQRLITDEREAVRTGAGRRRARPHRDCRTARHSRYRDRRCRRCRPQRLYRVGQPQRRSPIRL